VLLVALTTALGASAACAGVLGIDPVTYRSDDAGDAISSQDGAATTFCAPQNPPPLWCQDFDDAGLSASTAKASDGSFVILDDKVFVSPPRSAVARVVYAEPKGEAFLGHDVVGAPLAELSVEFMVRVESWDSTAQCGVAAIVSGSSANSVELSLAPGQDFVYVDNQVGTLTLPLTTRVPRGGSAWVAIKLAVDFAGSNPHVRVEVDHKVALDADATSPTGPFALDLSDPSFAAGATDLVTPTSAPWVIRIDNVVARGSLIGPDK
jgi:hypothetical protein